MSESRPMGSATVWVCVTCQANTGARLADATAIAAAKAADVLVRGVRCLGNCSRGLSAAMRSDHSWTYVFGGLDPARDGPALIIGARLLARSVDGILPWRERPESLKCGLVARIPPVDFIEKAP